MTLALPHPAASDKELISRIAARDLQALGDLFDRYEPELKRFIGRLGIASGDVDDLVQASFLEVIGAAQRFDPALPVKSWLFGIAVMLVRRHRRSLSRAAARLLAWANLPPREVPETPATALEKDRELCRFQRAFERLSAKKREVFALVVLEEVPGEEAARALGIPVNTVWTRLHHARRELRAALGEEPA